MLKNITIILVLMLVSMIATGCYANTNDTDPIVDNGDENDDCNVTINIDSFEPEYDYNKVIIDTEQLYIICTFDEVIYHENSFEFVCKQDGKTYMSTYNNAILMKEEE